MSNQPSWIKTAAQLCAEVCEEDGIDPRYGVAQHTRNNTPRKTLQLCKEATRIASLVLAGETQQAVLRDLQVLSVDAAQDGQSLCVSVGCYTEVPETHVLEALKKVQGVVRSALAQALHRKRAPMLTFRYIGVINQGGC